MLAKEGRAESVTRADRVNDVDRDPLFLDRLFPCGHQTTLFASCDHDQFQIESVTDCCSEVPVVCEALFGEEEIGDHRRLPVVQFEDIAVDERVTNEGGAVVGLAQVEIAERSCAFFFFEDIQQSEE